MVVVGGLDAGVRYEKYLGSPHVDLVVRGDGEETFVEILDRVDRGESLSGIPGTCEMVDGEGARRNPEWVRRIPFNDYPLPARDMVPRELYDSPAAQASSFPFANRYPAILMQGSRGCRLKCAFCDIVAVQDKWNEHSPEYVVDEIEHCVSEYGIREIVFVDDNFMLNKKWVVRICELIVERKLDIAIDVMPGISVWTLSPQIIDTMVEAGLYRICMPIESGNPETIKFIKKPVDLDKAVRSIDHCNRRGLFTYANLIIGFPYETQEDIDLTLSWAKTSGLDAANFYVAEPFQGARMFPIYRDNEWLVYEGSKKVSWRTQHFTREELEAVASEATRAYIKQRMRFYLNPLNFVPYLLPKLSSVAKWRYAAKVARYALVRGDRPTHDEGSVALLKKTKQAARLAVRGASSSRG